MTNKISSHAYTKCSNYIYIYINLAFIYDLAAIKQSLKYSIIYICLSKRHSEASGLDKYPGYEGGSRMGLNNMTKT